MKDIGTALRFFLNPKAGFFAKLFLVLAMLYVVMPVDLVPDVVVVVGWLDDLAAVLGATAALLLAWKRFRAEQAALTAPVPSFVTPRVVETQGTEVR
jgi:uncharacterized membrane protein YkvA (DUF1232 family)